MRAHKEVNVNGMGGGKVSSTLSRWSGPAATAGGMIFLLSTFLPYIRRAESAGVVTNVPLYALYLSLFTIAVILFTAALWGLRALHAEEGSPLRRPGRAGIWVVTIGAAVLVLASVQIVMSAAATGKLPEVWALFALGWLLLFVGFILTGIGAYRARLLGSARILPIVIAVGAFVAIMVSVDPFHDIGFLVVGLGWILLGVALWRRHGHDRSHTHPVRADLGVPG